MPRAEVIGLIVKTETPADGGQWMLTLAYGQYEDRTPTRGFEPTREDAMNGEYARHGHIEYSDRNVLSASIVATRRVALTSSIQTEDRCPERKPAVVS